MPKPPRSTRAERAVEAAGWIPFWNFDQQLVREDVEIVGGMRADSSLGVVRMPLPALTADFVRFTDTDALCCPSAHVTVRYRIDRTGAGPVVAPSEINAVRR
jgi:hypothetical protein